MSVITALEPLSGADSLLPCLPELPIEVESATWTAGGTLDWWVKERQQWLGLVRGPDGRQR
jgi:hypothetical protein